MGQDRKEDLHLLSYVQVHGELGHIATDPWSSEFVLGISCAADIGAIRLIVSIATGRMRGHRITLMSELNCMISLSPYRYLYTGTERT